MEVNRLTDTPKSEIEKVSQLFKVLSDPTRLKILMYLKEHGFFVSVVNPYERKKHSSQGLRRVKTDKQDAITICKYGLNY